MKEVKRYCVLDMHQLPSIPYIRLNGEWVYWKDYKELQEAYEKLKQETDKLKGDK